MPDRNRVVAISAPENDKASLPNEVKLAGVISTTDTERLTAYVDTVSNKPLLANLPKTGAVARTSATDALGITEWDAVRSAPASCSSRRRSSRTRSCFGP